MRRIILAMVAIALVTSPAIAQQEKGDTELQFQGSLSIGISGDQEDTGSFAINWGRFVTQQNELGISAFAFFTEDGDISGVGGPFWRLNFGSGTTVPYIGLSAYTDFGDFSTGDVFANVEGGSRWFLKRNVAFTLAGSILYDFDESDFADNLQVLFGFSYFWTK